MDHTVNTVAIFDKLARVYQDKYMDTSLYHASFDQFCAYIPEPEARVLELACGPGNITRYLLNKRPDLKILSTDLAPQMLELARTNNPEATFRLMDCRDIGKLSEQYDALMCGFALPYLSREEVLSLIADASRILEPGGVLYLSTMEDDYSKSGMRSGSTGDSLFVYFHEAAFLAKALGDHGFQVLHMHHQPFPGGDNITDLIIIAQQQHAWHRR
ncbi:class I SAM-dependent methyltransferase [Taibaiella chishuiensis]|uniref:Methyltransferase family protein n=1 Tax=Taibaiella chishuiensis TaxID=1434707 RepID=A0A2P8D1Q9_9BACT|nr:class I SAM-dependent methyltransferase [Taibaiella chishuiensis]PSK91131.1 methyltransferase family protein [Taibaiella chishuiensis]